MKKKNVLRKVAALVVIAMVVCVPIVNLAHSGRTDSSGGHKDNKNKSGLGSYHYHCGGNPPHLHTGGVCPYSSTPAASTQSTSTSTRTTTSSSSTKQAAPAKVNATSVEIDVADVQILIGETKELTATVSPSNATDKTITWKSDNKDVVMIDSEGELVAMGVGEATITATTSNGKDTTVKVTVNPIKVSEIKVNESELNLKVEDSVTLTAEVLPENATDKTIEWSSENPEIVTVEDGVIKAIVSGTTKVICKSKDGVKCEVSVTVEKEEIVEEEKTVETVASVDDETTSGEDSDAVAGAITLGTMVGIPAYIYNKKKKK